VPCWQPNSVTIVKAVTVLHKKGTVVKKKSLASKSKSTMENSDEISIRLLCGSYNSFLSGERKVFFVVVFLPHISLLFGLL